MPFVRPVFCKGDLVLSSSGSIIHAISVLTGEVIYSLRGHTATVDVIAVQSIEKSIIISGSRDGFMIVWDLNSRSQLNSYPIFRPIVSIILSIMDESKLVLVVGEKIIDGDFTKDSNVKSVVIYDCNSTSEEIIDVSKLGTSSYSVSTIKIADEEYVIFSHERTLVLNSMQNSTTYETETNTEPKIKSDITCIAAHGHQGLIITGHEQGEIMLWHNLSAWVTSQRKINLITTRFHWHAHPVVSLVFSSDGTHFYSGGNEGVLVIWPIRGSSKQSFFARLGAPITTIAVSPFNAKVCLTTADSCARIVNVASLREEWMMRSLCLGLTEGWGNTRQSGGKQTCKIIVDRHCGLLVCNGYPGRLQMYDIAAEICRAEVDVISYVRLSSASEKVPLYVPSVSLFQFSNPAAPGGHRLLATVDIQQGEALAPESSLKFWGWGAHKGRTPDTSNGNLTYRIQAQVDRPHGTSATVIAIAFHPTKPMLVTAASDGSIRIWSLGAAAGSHGKSLAWACEGSMKYRDCAVGAIAFSWDGSLLAITYANIITLWEPTSLSLQATVVNLTADDISFVSFVEPRASPELGGGCGEAFLVVGTARSLSVFDLLSMSFVWLYHGWFNNFATAVDDYHTIAVSSSQFPDKPSPITAGWIIAGARMYKSAIIKFQRQSEGNDERFLDLDFVEKIEDAVIVFNLVTKRPLLIQPLNSSVQSFVIWCPVRKIGSGVIKCILDNGHLFTLQPIQSQTDATKSEDINRGKVATVVAPSLPALPSIIASLATEGTSSTSKTPAKSIPISASVPEVAAMKPMWLTDIFDDSSDNIPSVSLLYDTFISNVLKRARDDSNRGVIAAFTSKELLESPDVSYSTQLAVAEPDDETDVEDREVLLQKPLYSFFSSLYKHKPPSQPSATAAVANAIIVLDEEVSPIKAVVNTVTAEAVSTKKKKSNKKATKAVDVKEKKVEVVVLDEELVGDGKVGQTKVSAEGITTAEDEVRKSKRVKKAKAAV